MDEFLYFLKYYIPLHGKIRFYNPKEKVPELREGVIPARLLRIKPEHIEEVDNKINKMAEEFRKINFKFVIKADFVKFYNYLGLVIYSLKLKKKYEL